jgi:hypothetical protein
MFEPKPMSAAKFLLIVSAFFLDMLLYSQPADSYYPPPEAVIYHNDTLTVLPPDSLPGAPVTLLGYIIYIDNGFFENITVTEPSDTIDFVPDISLINPGNHQFCVKVLYNEWISDAACDSGMVLYGFEIPFYEDWSSGNFTQNHWKTDSGNWTVEADEGNMAPAAVFSGIPARYNYEIPLESFAFRGDLLHTGRIWLSFNVMLSSITNTGNEKLIVQKWDWHINAWEDVMYFSNINGSFDWMYKSEWVLGTWPASQVFKLRFLATGDNSMDISSWVIDNVHVWRKCTGATNLRVEEHADKLVLYWEPPTGCYPVGIEWDDGVNSGNSIGTGGEVSFDVAARWDSSQITSYNGLRIHAISFFPAESQATYRARIWTGDSAEVLVYDSMVSNPVINNWNQIELDTTIIIDATKDLWIGYHVDALTGYPAGVDDGPAIDGYGNMMYWQDIWQTLPEINPELDFNWNIIGVLYPDPLFPEILKYNIYREENFTGYYYLDETDDWIYDDHNIIMDDLYCYYVTMVWTRNGDTCESVPTNEACEGIWTNSGMTGEDISIKIFPNPTRSIVNIKAPDNILLVKLYSPLGDIISENRMNQDVFSMDLSIYPDGVYFLHVETEKRNITEKIVLMK